MRIAINALLAGNLSGTGKYTTHLIKHLSKIDQNNEYIIFVPADESLDFLADKENFKRIKIPYRDRRRLIWEQTILPLKVKRLKADLLHPPAFISPFINIVPSVITVHDMAFKRHPWTIAEDRKRYYDRLIPRSIKNADTIIAVSEFTRSEIIKYFPDSKRKIRVTLEGVDKFFLPAADESMIKTTLRKYNLEEGFILSVGTIEPRKNFLRLLDAYERLVKEQGIEEKLVIVGRMGWGCEDLIEKTKRKELKGRVVMPGFVSPQELSAIYQGASIFVLPSLYEGFGLPILEAMAFGLPVITSRISALPEVAGGAALLVNPYSRREIANAILKFLKDEELCRLYSVKSSKRVEDFDWNETAAKTIEIYRETLSK